MYLVALLVVVMVAALCWKAFGPVRGDSRARGGRIIGPDDDPEFLWSISQHQHPGGDSPDS